jgi:hypothetical protein
MQYIYIEFKKFTLECLDRYEVRSNPNRTGFISSFYFILQARVAVEIENTFVYMMRRSSEDRFLLSFTCKPAIKAKVSYIMEPLPLKGFFTMDTVPRQNVIIVVR